MKIIPFFVSMNVGLFFDPVDEQLLPSANLLHCFAHNIHINQGLEEPDWQEFDICVFSVAEYRGEASDINTTQSHESMRSYLYNLSKGKGSYKILDLGYLRPGDSLSDTQSRIQEVCQLLMNAKVLPLIIGGAHDLDIGQFSAYSEVNKMINVLSIDSNIDILESDKEAETHTKKILTDERGFLSSYTHVAQQNFLVNKSALDIFEKLNIKAFRLGEIQNDLARVEPEIRNSDMISFDLNALKFGEGQATFGQHPFGLTAFEACRLAWYAGMSNRVSSIGFYGLHPSFDDLKQTEKILATMIWHFVDGFYNETESLYFEGGEYQTYRVHLDQTPEEITFYKGNVTGKWWMNLSLEAEINLQEVVPCRYEDYLEAQNGEVPERFLQGLTQIL